MSTHSPTAVAAAMFAKDTVAQHLDMAVITVALGQATVRMSTTPAMCNGVGTVHGGYIFTLADTAFAYACNSSNTFAVAADCSIQFLRPVFAGDTLMASASETAAAGRTGIYDVVVRHSETLEIVATFRGKSAQVKGVHIQDATV